MENDSLYKGFKEFETVTYYREKQTFEIKAADGRQLALLTKGQAVRFADIVKQLMEDGVFTCAKDED
jgi:hypothetical protein